MKTAITSLIIAVGALLAVGLVMLYSSSMAQKGAHYLTLQLIWGGIGIVLCVFASMNDYKNLKYVNWVLFPAVLLMLGAVLIPGIGVYRNGSRRWFDLGISLFQPSEAAKISLVIALAWYGEKYQRQMREFWRGLVFPGLILLAVLVLIYREPDRGTTILLAAVGGSLLLLSGVRWLFILPPGLIGAAYMTYSLIHDPTRLRRLVSWLHPEEHKTETGYQAWQAMLALGAGGVDGLGLGNGRQKLGFLPEHHTDFIFSVLGEEMGLVATLSILLLFTVFIICGIYIACKAADTFGFLLGAGITLLIGLQAFINIGVVTSALPNKGLPLPFISYGGSNLALMLICAGILISIGRHSHKMAAISEVMVDDANLAPA